MKRFKYTNSQYNKDFISEENRYHKLLSHYELRLRQFSVLAEVLYLSVHYFFPQLLFHFRRSIQCQTLGHDLSLLLASRPRPVNSNGFGCGAFRQQSNQMSAFLLCLILHGERCHLFFPVVECCNERHFL